jgi:hypothetical protein
VSEDGANDITENNMVNNRGRGVLSDPDQPETKIGDKHLAKDNSRLLLQDFSLRSSMDMGYPTTGEVAGKFLKRDVTAATLFEDQQEKDEMVPEGVGSSRRFGKKSIFDNTQLLLSRNGEEPGTMKPETHDHIMADFEPIRERQA